MIRDAQEKGAIPVLLTLTPLNEWHEGKPRGFVYLVREKKAAAYFNHDHISLKGTQLNAQAVAKGLIDTKHPAAALLKTKK